MKTIYFIFVLAISSMFYYKHAIAHGTNSDIEKREADKKVAKKQQDQADWENFMKAIKEQDAKKEK